MQYIEGMNVKEKHLTPESMQYFIVQPESMLHKNCYWKWNVKSCNETTKQWIPRTQNIIEVKNN